MNNSGNTHPATSPELCDELRQLRWAYLDTLPGRVADVMLRAADFVEAAMMSQPQSPDTSDCSALNLKVPATYQPATSLSDAVKSAITQELDREELQPFERLENATAAVIAAINGARP